MRLFGKKKECKQLITIDDICVGNESVDKFEAIRMAGRMLVAKGCVDEDYIESMIDREKIMSTYLGSAIAAPHGSCIFKSKVKKSGIVCLQFPNGVNFNGSTVNLVIGIAGVDNDHLEILKGVATICEDEFEAKKLIVTNHKEYVRDTLQNSICV